MPPDQMQFKGGLDASYTQSSPSTSTFVRWVLAAGLAKNEQTANYVLVGIAVLALLLAFLAPSFISSSRPQVSLQEVDAAMHSLQPTTP